MLLLKVCLQQWEVDSAVQFAPGEAIVVQDTEQVQRF